MIVNAELLACNLLTSAYSWLGLEKEDVMHVALLTQTAKGVHDPGRLFELRLEIGAVSQSLFLLLSQIAHKAPVSINCHIIAEAYAQVFTDFEVERVRGFFGVPDMFAAEPKQFEHSWLVSKAAPEWVIDVSPFNGLLNAFFVNSEEYPWRGLYRPDVSVAPQLCPKEQRTTEIIKDILLECRK